MHIHRVSSWGQIIRDARIAKGLTQTELADELGVSQSTIARWEKGEYLIGDNVARLFDTLGIEANLETNGSGS